MSSPSVPADTAIPQSITFVIREEDDGGYCASAVGEAIFTQGDTREEVLANIREALRCHFEPEREVPRLVHLHYVRDEVVAA